jgi:hypothetical protein
MRYRKGTVVTLGLEDWEVTGHEDEKHRLKNLSNPADPDALMTEKEIDMRFVRDEDFSGVTNEDR